ncbi:protein of unknown function (DUF2499) [Rubidibacter lacunae KORDI 51-2]|uniref:Ycf49-like protein n=1 Tax=Rubidibacter lacunae KORDI 51-2 TaxID=582515 RepID=U5DN79_9CHRO|nr:DUF2499 domain-containing protein [Rubidibacter lacunae]ERN43101.1 protein of unknown function (DUF2499) [Rubidibacter lacunae KORDI 51-2]
MHVLSIPTWIVHISSVIEWAAAIWFVWRFGELTGDRDWFWLAWGMLPALVSAMCAVTWHFFDNAPTLSWLVTMQAAFTVVGNVTLCAAAWWIWRGTRSTELPQSPANFNDSAERSLHDGSP